MSINLFLARHGNTFETNQIPVLIGKRTDLSLVEKGREQASILGKHFNSRGIKFDAIFSGKLKRQQEFAQIIANELSNSNKLTVTEALDEIDYGTWEGSPPNFTDAKYEAWSKKGVWPEAFSETEASRCEILLNWLNCLRSQYEDNQNILAVSSNGIIRLFAKFSDLSCGETIWSRLSETSSIEQLKLNTGAYSELILSPLGVNIDLKRWNIKPQ